MKRILIIEYGANVNAKKYSGRTALMDASMHGHENIVKLLIAAGADVNATTDSGLTALISGVSSFNKNIVELLIKSGADVNVKSDNGRTALWEAKYFAKHLTGYEDIIKLLINAGAK